MYLVLTGAWVSLHIMHEVRGNLGNPGRQTKDKVQGNEFELPPLHLPQRTIFLALVRRDPSRPLLISQDPSCPRQLSSEILILKDLEKRSQ